MGQQFQGFSFQYPGILRQGGPGRRRVGAPVHAGAGGRIRPPLSPDLAVDGVYGARTTQAVRAYQQSRGLQADGVVGEETWYSIYGDFTGIERDLRNDNINFPQGNAAQAMSQESASYRYGASSRHGQFPGQDLELGSSDQKGVSLV